MPMIKSLGMELEVKSGDRVVFWRAGQLAGAPAIGESTMATVVNTSIGGDPKIVVLRARDGQLYIATFAGPDDHSPAKPRPPMSWDFIY